MYIDMYWYVYWWILLCILAEFDMYIGQTLVCILADIDMKICGLRYLMCIDRPLTLVKNGQ